MTATNTETAKTETDRIRALKASRLLDTPPEEVFDRLTTLAARALSVPIALISLVDENRQFFKSQVGLPTPVCDLRETPLSHSFCQHVVAIRQALVVSDARDHPLLASNLAVRDLGVIAYAGVPLTDSAGNCFGSLCAIDFKPREWTAEDLHLLRHLAAHTMAEVEIRTRTLTLERDIAEMHRKDAELRTRNRLTVHDLRTPLNSLLLGIEILIKLGLSGKQSEWATLTRRSGLALKDLVDGLIESAASSETTPAVEKSSPQSLVDSAVSQVKGSAYSKKLRLEVQLNAELPLIEVDSQKIIRVLVNLLGNAIKFTPENGTITLKVRPSTPGHVEFIITDTGIGFDQSKAEVIFNRGVMLNEDAEPNTSTGWGLEFCKRTVEAHHGKITAQSTVGKGTIMTVDLPVQAKDASVLSSSRTKSSGN